MVIAQQWISLDGFVADAGGDETAVFAFVGADGDAASAAHNRALLGSVDEILLGRRTYEAFVTFWPGAGDTPMAAEVNAIPKVVASSTLGAAPWGDHAPATIVADGVAHVRGRAGGDGDTIVWGSLALMGSLLAAGELDALELLIAPGLLGAGVPLVDAVAAGAPRPLTLVEQERWPDGVLRARYAVSPAGRAAG